MGVQTLLALIALVVVMMAQPCKAIKLSSTQELRASADECDFVCPRNSKVKPNRKCLDAFSDCECLKGFERKKNKCVKTTEDKSEPANQKPRNCDFVCPQNSKVKPNRKCLDAFSDCECIKGFEARNGRCVKQKDDNCDFKCPKNSEPKPNRKCLDAFSDCNCFTGFKKSNGRCVAESIPTKNDINNNNEAKSQRRIRGKTKEPTKCDDPSFPPGITQGGVAIDVATFRTTPLFALTSPRVSCIPNGAQRFDTTESFVFSSDQFSKNIVEGSTIRESSETFREQQKSFNVRFFASASGGNFLVRIKASVSGSRSAQSRFLTQTSSDTVTQTRFDRHIAKSGSFGLVKGKLMLNGRARESLLRANTLQGAINFVLTFGTHFLSESIVGGYFFTAQSFNQEELERFELSSQSARSCLEVKLSVRNPFFRASAGVGACRSSKDDQSASAFISQASFKSEEFREPANFNQNTDVGAETFDAQNLFANMPFSEYSAPSISIADIFEWLHPTEELPNFGGEQTVIEANLIEALNRYTKWLDPKRCESSCGQSDFSIVNAPTIIELINDNGRKKHASRNCNCVCSPGRFGDRCDRVLTSGDRFNREKILNDLKAFKSAKLTLDLDTSSSTIPRIPENTITVAPGAPRERLAVALSPRKQYLTRYTFDCPKCSTSLKENIRILIGHAVRVQSLQRRIILAPDNVTRTLATSVNPGVNDQFFMKIFIEDNKKDPTLQFMQENCFLSYGWSEEGSLPQRSARTHFNSECSELQRTGPNLSSGKCVNINNLGVVLDGVAVLSPGAGLLNQRHSFYYEIGCDNIPGGTPFSKL